MVTIEQKEKIIFDKLVKIYTPQESISISKKVLLNILNWDNIKYSLNKKEEFPSEKEAILDFYLVQLLDNKPIQYVFGESFFMDLPFKVNENVLIPRPETEELVMLILNECKDKINVLDICTGSGCIAISLKKNNPNFNVSAIDISSKALEIARENATYNKTDIVFYERDILKTTQLDNKWDVIVSNPPYIRNSEKELMSKNVLDHEPHLALFVEDDNPLIFYYSIINFAYDNLNSEGLLYFEINEAFGEQIKLIMEKKGFVDVQIIVDFYGKNRIVKGIRKNIDIK